MKTAIALASFRRSDTKEWVKRGATISGDPAYIDDLERNRLVYLVSAHAGAPEQLGNGSPPGGRKPSVSPPGRPSKGKTAKPSGAGEKQDQDEA